MILSKSSEGLDLLRPAHFGPVDEFSVGNLQEFKYL